MKRHCAYCLIEINDEEKIIKCSGCLRRVYCSKECQTIDWGSKGQTHKEWCKDEIGEEDIDWEIRETQGKGLGVFAKRFLPKHTKIMVDKGYRSIEVTPFAFINSLMPHGEKSTLQEKWDLNSFFTPEGGDNLGIRLARVNHDCRNNATNKFIPDLESFVLIAIKDIEKDEEISIQYYYYNDFSSSLKVRQVRESVIRPKWDIVCDETCICKNKEIVEKIQKAHELDALIPTLKLKSEQDILNSLKLVDDLLAMGQELSSGIMPLARTYFDGFQIAILNKNTYPLHKKYIEKYLEACEIVDSKHSNSYRKALQYYQIPNSHRNHYDNN